MEDIKLIKSECTTVIMLTLQNHKFSTISTLINQGKKWVELFLAIIQPKFKSSLNFFTLNMPTLHKITKFKSSRDIPMDVSEVHTIRRSADYEALK